MGSAHSTNGEKRNAYRLLIGMQEVGRPRRRWVNNIKMDLRLNEVVKNLVNLAQVGTGGGPL
jgi:hypothetical protein